MIWNQSHFMHGCCWSRLWGRWLLTCCFIVSIKLWRKGSWFALSALRLLLRQWLLPNWEGVRRVWLLTHCWGILEQLLPSLFFFLWWKYIPMLVFGEHSLLYWVKYFHYWSVLFWLRGCWANVCRKCIRSCWAIMNLLSICGQSLWLLLQPKRCIRCWMTLRTALPK